MFTSKNLNFQTFSDVKMKFLVVNFVRCTGYQHLIWDHFIFKQKWNSTTGTAIIKGPVIVKPQPFYGFMTLIPVLLTFTLTTLHWYQTEESSKKLRTLPLLLTQIWPQYRVGRILWLYKKGNDKWIKEKELLGRKLSFFGEFSLYLTINDLSVGSTETKN